MEKNTPANDLGTAADYLNWLDLANDEKKRAEEAMEQCIRGARAQGASWEAIGKTLGLSKQTAFNRYSKATEPKNAVQQHHEEAAKFLDGKEPAKTKTPAKTPKTASKKVDRTAPAKEQFPNNQELWPWVHSLTADYDKHEQDPSYPAQPGTGKGPQVCPSCGNNNHHGPQRFTIKFLRECSPTRYDPAGTVQAMADWKAYKAS